MDKKISVVIAEDHEILRKHYIDLLRYEPGINLVGWAANSQDLLDIVKKECPDIILMDIEMESKDAGIKVTRKILRDLPNTKVIMLTVHEDDNSIYKAFQAGAVNYVLKSSSLIDILKAIKDAYEDKSSLSPFVANRIVEEFKKLKSAQESLLSILELITRLTRTEVDILLLLHKGKTQKEIAKIRYIELTTVKTHVKNILGKFDKRRIKEVIKIVNEFGLTTYLEKVK